MAGDSCGNGESKHIFLFLSETGELLKREAGVNPARTRHCIKRADTGRTGTSDGIVRQAKERQMPLYDVVRRYRRILILLRRSEDTGGKPLGNREGVYRR